jgi:16S rRNA (guanine527-N7)-methyltransferase
MRRRPESFHVKRDRQQQYIEMLLSAPISLTAVSPEDAWERHVEDSLAALPLLHGVESLIDVGAGGGAPGVPLAIELGLSVTLLEATGTKARFLESVLQQLGLPGDVVAQRSEEYARGEGRDRFDAAVARALASPSVAVELCLPLVRPGGHLVLWTGDLPEIEQLERVAQMLSGTVEGVHPGAGGRSLVRVDKLAATPERFPRRPGMARKRPLASLPSTA